MVEDDFAVRESVVDLLTSVRVDTLGIGTAREFMELQQRRPDQACWIIDVRLPDRNGIELFEDVVRQGASVPAIFITGFADVRMAVRAMHAGAFDFLTKPFSDQELLDTVQRAIRHHNDGRGSSELVAELQRRFDLLTARERELMAFVISGRRNKEIAAEMGVADITVKAHRTQVMKKMAARSVAALIGMAQLLGHDYARPLALLPEGDAL